MRHLIIGVVAIVATSAQAQVADRLARRIEPNAIDRSLSQASTPAIGAQADADRQRSEQAARDAATRRGPPLTSTTVDGPAGVQRFGSGVAPSSPMPPLPLPLS